MGEIIFLTVFFVAAVSLYTLTGDFCISKMDTSGGAAMFPRLVIILLCICLILRIGQIIWKKEKKGFVWKELFMETRRFFVVSLLVYVALLKPLGYIPATCLFLIVTVGRLRYYQKGGYGRAGEVLVRDLLLIAFCLAMYAAFSGILSVNLPKGLLA